MRKKPSYPIEFKQEAVRLMRDGAKSVAQVAKDLGISESALRRWEQEMGGSARHDAASDYNKELQQLRQEVRILRMEREILKKAAAFFAKESL